MLFKNIHKFERYFFVEIYKIEEWLINFDRKIIDIWTIVILGKNMLEKYNSSISKIKIKVSFFKMSPDWLLSYTIFLSEITIFSPQNSNLLISMLNVNIIHISQTTILK